MKNAIGRLVSRFIRCLGRMAGLDLVRLAYAGSGINQSHSFQASGEMFFICKFFAERYKAKSPLIFDVGANRGQYAGLVLSEIPMARLICFEPNPSAFQLLDTSLSHRVKSEPLGLGRLRGKQSLFFDELDPVSVMATSNSEILKSVSGVQNPMQIEIDIDTIDSYCQTHEIERIDLLKIDTEGFELDVLQGAARMIAEDRIAMVQFEFNETSAVQRIFLRDFYTVLPGFGFYRLSQRGLIPLGSWQAFNEIFQFQNILAVRKFDVDSIPSHLLARKNAL